MLTILMTYMLHLLLILITSFEYTTKLILFNIYDPMITSSTNAPFNLIPIISLKVHFPIVKFTNKKQTVSKELVCFLYYYSFEKSRILI